MLGNVPLASFYTRGAPLLNSPRLPCLRRRVSRVLVRVVVVRPDHEVPPAVGERHKGHLARVVAAARKQAGSERVKRAHASMQGARAERRDGASPLSPRLPRRLSPSIPLSALCGPGPAHLFCVSLCQETWSSPSLYFSAKTQLNVPWARQRSGTSSPWSRSKSWGGILAVWGKARGQGGAVGGGVRQEEKEQQQQLGESSVLSISIPGFLESPRSRKGTSMTSGLAKYAQWRAR
jgi:hypothetical protein